tara:strand:+ start:305 stop:787 length:483 start_codon:yes stop_codon:yes gene_type:complete
MKVQYGIDIFLSFVSLFILVSVYKYLGDLKSCSCFIENQHPKYKVNVEFLQFYQILEILALFIFICFITMYKSKFVKNGGSKMGMKFFVLFSAALFLFISGYTSYYSIIMYFMSKEDCLCVNQWQKYIIYIQGAFNSIYFLRLLFLFVFISLLLSFNMKY